MEYPHRNIVGEIDCETHGHQWVIATDTGREVCLGCLYDKMDALLGLTEQGFPKPDWYERVDG